MYIVLVNIHGLVRGHDIEFGRDADTGGQTRYVIDMAKALGRAEGVDRVELVTRILHDKTVSKDYALAEEPLVGTARIVRLVAGGTKYIRKERLWPVLDEFADRLVAYLRRQDRLPDVIHGHYADGAYVASRVAELFGLPFVYSAHSLGRNKLAFLESQGWTERKAEERFAIGTRIRREEQALSRADLVVTSTTYERDELFASYEHRARPRYSVIPPGLDLKSFFPYYEYELPGDSVSPEQKQAQVRMRNELRRFHFNPDKPLILTLCRPDARKNIDLLIQAYGEDKELQAMANLAVFAGLRDDINAMEEGERQVLTDILLAMDRYDLYGKMAVPKNHDPATDVPELYRLAALSHGVFASASFLETFGLTLIEAAATGLPFVAMGKGGPVDIAANLGSGLLIDPDDPGALARGLKAVLTDTEAWIRRSEDGINNTRTTYSWDVHARLYLEELRRLGPSVLSPIKRFDTEPAGLRFKRMERMLVADIDDTLLGDEEATRALGAWLRERGDSLGFGVATGRSLESAREALAGTGLPTPALWICGVGSYLGYGRDAMPDSGWEAHISQRWKPDAIRAALANVSGIRLQDSVGAQGPYKISYYIDEVVQMEELLPRVHAALGAARLWYNLVASHGKYIDILPYRAGKGKAIRYLSVKWNISLDTIITAGNSGNDKDMLIGSMRGIVVANRESELESISKNSRVFMAKAPYAAGVLEGLQSMLRHGEEPKPMDAPSA